MNYPHLLTLLLILGAVICPYWKDQLTRENENDLSEEQIEKLLNIEYEPNDFMEEVMGSYASSAPEFMSKLNTQSDCAERRSFSGPDILQFLPQIKAVIRNTKEVLEFTNDCFAKNTIQMISNDNKGKVVLGLKSSEPYSLFCKDSYIIALSSKQKVKIVFSKGEHKITFDKLTQDDLIEIAVNGIRVFAFCESISETVISVYKTVKFFMESLHHRHEDADAVNQIPYYKKKPQQEVELDHMKFLNKFSSVEIEPRQMGSIPLPIEDSIQSGDFIGLTQIDSLVSTMIMFMSGGRISHAAIALRLENNALYVAEMKGSGLIISTWKEFIDEQIFTHHFVVHCPLKKEHREKFDTKKAYAYFKSLGKMKYGDYALLTPWFDVPNQATAAYIPEENFLLLLSLIEKFSKDITHKNVGAALNMRLGTDKLSMSQITIEAAKRGMTFEQLMAMPEKDEWRYDSGDNIICSSFVVLMYQAGGLFEGIDINAKEFQPKDIYLLNFFDKEFERPQICKDIDPDLPYCQVLGTYRLRLKGYSTISPFDHMFENCPNVPPFYPLTDKC